VTFSDRLVRELFCTLTDELAAGREIDVRGFGRFRPATWAARDIPTPGGGRKRLPERKCVRFRAGATLKRSVRNGP